MASPDVVLQVNGRAYGGWKSIRVTCGIETVAGGFELAVTDKWAGQSLPWPIAEEDECKLLLGGAVVITGYVDRVARSLGREDMSLTVSGRDKTGALVDCSAFLDKWEFRRVPLLTLAKRVADPFGISVSLQSGITLPDPPAKLSVDPGDSAFDVIERACRTAGLLPVSDGVGGLVLTRAGTTRTKTALVQGENILAASSDFDATGRFSRYHVLGQHQGTDEISGVQAAAIKGSASDANVRRTERVLVVRPEGNVTLAQAKRRAEWEATVRAARGDSVSVTVQGWRQGDGSRWPVNSVVHVQCPAIRVDGDLLITQAVYSLDESGTTTELTLKRPDAFQPEPVVATGSGNNYWKEIVKGV